MKIFSTKKRVAVLSLAAVAVVGAGAIQAGAIGTDLTVRGSGTFCLTSDAARALADQKVALEPTGAATASGNCITLPGSGTVSPTLTGGELPLEGGMRFTSTTHQLDVTKFTIHVRIGEGYTSATVAQDAEPASDIDIFRFPVSLSLVSFTPRSVDTKNAPVMLSSDGAAAFTRAFGAAPVASGKQLFTFDGHGEITTR
ncbi:HtaA domain-containing protein [Streptomyces sp. NPDC091204]|uniref:HtaA domain-containing protein n=1 Tax=Streptomyces sp. NPDC091204 TaxID=3155299 RepID=UPI0034236CDB